MGVQACAAVGKNHSLQHIDRLCNVGHDDGITMIAKDVQVDCSNQGIPHSVLLVQEMGVGSFLHIKPCTPFINYKPQILLGQACRIRAVWFSINPFI